MSAPATHAGIVSRGLVGLVDLLVVVVTLGGLYLGLVLATLMFNPTAFRFPEPNIVFSTAVGFAVAVLYLGMCWALSGCTVGAVVLGVRVVGRNGERLRVVVAALRAAACVVFPIGLLWVAVDQQRRSVQDIVLGTRVVYAR